MKRTIKKKIVVIRLIASVIVIMGASKVQSYGSGSNKFESLTMISHDFPNRQIVVRKNITDRIPIRVVVAQQVAQAYVSAAKAVAEKLGVPLATGEMPESRALNIGPPEFAKLSPIAKQLLTIKPEHPQWDLICEDEGGTWVVTGATPFAAAHAALTLVDWLRWGEPMPQPFRKVREPVFNSMTIEFDDWITGWSRLADGFDMKKHIADAARVGIEAMEANLLADAIPVQVKERRVYEDMYQWWCIYLPGLDMFFESELTRGTYKKAMLNRNLAKLKATVEIYRGWGITPTFIAFEPRVWPERLYDKYPELRGTRVDYSKYSADVEYAPDVNHPWVQRHYAEMMTQLMEAVPDIGLFSVWSNESNAGFPWSKRFFMPNGPIGARRVPVEESVKNLMITLRDAGRKVNPHLQVTIGGSFFAKDEVEPIVRTLPDDIGISYTTQPGKWEPIESIRNGGKEVQVQVEQISNPWKPIGPLLGIPSPWLVYEKLCDILINGKVQDFILRGGIQSEVFVPNFITNEVIRAFKFQGTDLDVDALIAHRAKAWTKNKDEAEALIKAWRLCDSAVRDVQVISGWVNFISGRTLMRNMVCPIVPNQALLTEEDKSYYERFVFLVGESDPGWVDNFYLGWGRDVKDDVAHESVNNFDNNLLPKLRKAIETLKRCEPLSQTVRDVRDRIQAFEHMLTTDRNLIEVQEAIHACLAESRTRPEMSGHQDRIRRAMENELNNVRQFIKLLESSPSTLIPVTSGVETTFIHRAPFSHLLKLKIDRMERHMDDPPGPWFDELMQPGGWTSDLLDKIPEPFDEQR